MDAHALPEFQPEPVGTDRESLKRSIANRLLYTVGKDPHAAHPRDWLTALSHVVRDRLVERWMATTRAQYQQDVKRVYYFSLEYLVGRALTNGLLALGVYEDCRAALAEMGIELSQLEALEEDAALGNGGLGRLAACFLDSMATLDLPGFGYGIRYDYGMFAQAFKDGWQVEHPDHWLAAGNPWEFPRSEVVYPVKFGGRVERRDGVAHWVDSDDVQAMAYDTIVPGYGTHAVNTLRLWSAKSTRDIDLAAFNRGHYSLAVEAKNHSENVSRVLYPDDSSAEGRELRLRQEYFFVSASLQDILRRFRGDHQDWDLLPTKAAVHLNDTHPALAVPELMRLLTDVHGLPWDQAWELSGRVFSYTNHTLMPEALETWPTELLAQVLPRILEIILQINSRFLKQVSETHGADLDLLSQVSLIEEDGQQRARMGHLSVLASHKINGVSAIHSGLVRDTLFADFARLYPERFVNVTNGVTPRRWLNQANPELATLIDARIGDDWRVDLDRLGDLAPLAADPELGTAFRAIKTANKTRLAKLVAAETGVILDPASLFDVHVKRIHEYKRQLLNLLQVIARYNRIKADPDKDWVPRSVIFAGKAASAYWMAKLIIKLIFVPNYSVSAAEVIIPAAELSEQISTAGTEGSGTGNMKLALNGALTIGTEDGANIEILEAVGADNIFILGLKVDEVAQLRRNGYDPTHYYNANSELKQVLEQIAEGHFSPEQPDRFQAIVDALTAHGDHYLVLADFADYMACQDRVDQAYRDPADWTRRAILNVAAMGRFSSDRAIRTYAETVWSVEPLKF
jgi:starch phosphorylase